MTGIDGGSDSAATLRELIHDLARPFGEDPPRYQVKGDPYKDTPPRDYWRMVLGLGDFSTGLLIPSMWAEYQAKIGDNPVYLRRLATVLQLPKRVRADVMSLPLSARLRGYLAEPLSDIDLWLRQICLQLVEDVQEPTIDTRSVTAWQERLLDCSAELSLVQPKGVPPSDVRQVRESAHALHEVVTAAEDLDPAVAKFILRHLAAIHNALSDYAFAGPSAVEATVTRVYGDLLIRHENLSGRVEPGDDRWRSFWDIVDKAARIVTIATFVTVPVAGMQLREAIESGPASSPTVEILDPPSKPAAIEGRRAMPD